MKSSTIFSSSPTDSSVFNPIDLESSLGRIEDVTANEGKMMGARQDSKASTLPSLSFLSRDRVEANVSPSFMRHSITRTSSRTPFLGEAGKTSNSDSQNSLLAQPYPISETDDEIKERIRLTETGDWSHGLAIGRTPPQNTPTFDNDNVATENADQQSMMEVTVDDFVLSAAEATSLTDVDATTIQEDPDGFWDMPVHVVTTLSMDDKGDVDIMNGCSVPYSVTFSNHDHAYMMDNEDGIIITDADADASPIRSVDMEW